MNTCANPKPAPKVEERVDDKKPQGEVAPAVPSAGKTVDPSPVHSIRDRVHFAREGAELSDVSALVLEQVSYVLRANPAIILDLVGYANELSTPDENEKLAIARAQAVQEYLIETGVGRERLMVKPGAVSPMAQTSSTERAKARRVELVPTNSESIPMDYQDKDLTTEGP